MIRYIIVIVAAAFPLIAGCPSGKNANVEHGNVSIDLSPDGTSVVFSSADGDLYIFDLTKKTASRLTGTIRIESYPSFSPDGNRIVFSASNGNTKPYHICLLDLSTLKVEQLTSGEGTSDILPRFRPDGRQIVFARAYRHRPYSLGGWTWDQWDACEISDDGNGFLRLTNDSYYQMYRIVPRSDRSIIYAADLLGVDDAPRAALFSADSSGKTQRLIPSKSEQNSDVHAWASDPMIAPDETTLTFCSDRQQRFWYDVCITDAENRHKFLVGNRSRYNRYPDFFPDGKRIVFLAGTEFNAGSRALYSLWEVSLDGSTRVIETSDLFTNPTHWLPGEKAEHIKD
jgi:Tol biopolymer transport system component